MKGTPPLDKIEKGLRCIWLWWSTEDEVDYTIRAPMSNMKMKWSKTREWVKVKRFSTIEESLHEVRSAYAILHLSSRLYSAEPRFCKYEIFSEHVKLF